MAPRLIFRAALALVAALACILPLAMACGPEYPLATFISEHPDLPLDAYAGGNLGVVLPSFSIAYLTVAYRYFAGRPFDAAEQRQIVNAWNSSLYAYIDKRPSEGQNTAPIYTVLANGYSSYANCLGDARETAEETRQDRIRQFGADSAAVASWSAAQTVVFDNCDGATEVDPSVPGPADPSLPQLIRKDRDYQIAAAYFYGGRFDEAKKRFLAISADPDSPWRATAALVAARCDIRAVTVPLAGGPAGSGPDDESRQKLLAADEQLKAVIANPAFGSMKASAERLRGFVGYRLDPDGQVNELADAIARGTAPEAIAANLEDYQRLMRGGRPFPRSAAAGQVNDLTDWIRSFALRFGGQDHRIARWEETQSPAWLAAALTYAQPGDAKAAELLDAAAKLPVTSPAYLTVSFYRNRLLAHGGRPDQARTNLDQVLSLPRERLSPSARNLFLALRMQSAKNLEEFLQFAPRKALGVTLSLDSSDPELCDRSGACVAQNGPLLDSDSALELTEALPTAELVGAAKTTALPPELRVQVAQAAWVRAVLLEQDDSARELAPVLATIDPVLAPALTDYGGQPSSAEREFAAVFLILHRPAMTPYLHAGVGLWSDAGSWEKMDREQQNWWCTFAPAPPPGTPFTRAMMNTGMLQGRMGANLRGGLSLLYPEAKPVAPEFLTQVERQAAANEWNSMLQVDAAPDWLTRQVLNWAKEHADDPRVPEALHRAVVASRYGCTDAATGTYSKQAFTLLHDRYPKSTWTAQTPYWFN